MANYYTTTNVLAFPVTYRTQNLGGKYTSEVNITNLFKSFIANSGTENYKSFVADYDSKNKLKVVINGYYFEYTIANIPTNTWLYIKVINGYLVSLEDESVTLDSSDGNFKGLGWLQSENKPTELLADNIYSLKITDENGKLINRGYIPSILDENGNWYDFSKIFSWVIIEGDQAYINPEYIYGVEVFNNKYVFNKFVTGDAERLVVVNRDNTGKITSITPNDHGRRSTATNMAQRWIWFSDGKPTDGNRINITTGAKPASSPAPQLGDFWFVIKAE